MTRPLRLMALALALALPVAAPAQTASSSSSPTMSFGDALNQFRAQSGLGGLRESPALSRAAQGYAEAMARGGFFSHVGQDGSHVGDRARRAGCNGRGWFAENIAWGQRTASDAFNGWARSAGHRENMLGRPYGVFGLGQSSGYWVLMFADAC